MQLACILHRYIKQCNFMANTATMDTHFESQKNMKAGGYTLIITVCLLLLFIYVKWSAPALPAPVLDEGIEVNLGNSDAGLGTDQPYEPGPPAPQEQQEYTPPKAAVAENNDAKDVETDDAEEEAPVVKKPPVVKPEATKIPEKEVANKPVKATQPAVTAAPTPPRPKAVFKGVNGTGTGGNEADSYKKGGNEGIAGGRGDQGRPGGDPNSKNYEGSGGRGNSGVSISRGLQGRRMTSLPSFEDEFNENAKVAVDIRVDETGRVTSAVYQPRGSTTASQAFKTIAIRKAMQIKFNAGTEESMGTIIFNFRLRN
jgi:outer membrane biosynthesis protein TonB